MYKRMTMFGEFENTGKDVVTSYLKAVSNLSTKQKRKPRNISVCSFGVPPETATANLSNVS
jgi:hypothetical protein